MHPFIILDNLFFLEIQRCNKSHYSKYYILFVKCEVTGESVSFELPLTVHADHLVNVIVGSCLATLHSYNDASAIKNATGKSRNQVMGAIQACNFEFAPSSTEEKKYLADEDVVKLFPSNQFCMEYKIYNGQLHLLQLNVVRQWHGGACGYHALFNVLMSMQYANNPANYDLEVNASDVQHFEFNVKNQAGNLMNNERYMWKKIFGWNVMLQKANRFRGLSCGILDEVHLRYLVENDPDLKGKISVMVNDTMGSDYISTLTEKVYAKFRVNRPESTREFFLHGFILGCSVHWVGAVIGISCSNPALSFVIYCDSHNTPIIQFIKKSHDLSRLASASEKKTIPSFFQSMVGKRRSVKKDENENEHSIVKLPKTLLFTSPNELANNILERYSYIWMHKLRINNPEYQEYPQRKLLELFKTGLEEFYKGKPKNKLWWTHRPFDIRRHLLIVEFTAGVAFLEALRGMCFEIGQRFWEMNLIKEGDQTQQTQTPLTAARRASDRYHAKLRRFEEEESRQQQVKPNLDCSLNLFIKRYTQAINQQEQHERLQKQANRVNPDWTILQKDKFYAREEKYIPNSDPRYKAGNKIDNRIEPPSEELAGDIFDRQRVIVKFNQRKIEDLVCLVVGTGGLGMNVSTCLARLGVARIILLDYDTVEASNLTRQCLASVKDAIARKPKVIAAKENLNSLHNLRSVVEAYNVNVISSFDIVVQLSQRADAVFNCVDCGVMFDYSLNSLSKSLGNILISGQSFSWKYMTEIYSGKPNQNCAFCEDVTQPNFGLGSKKKHTLARFSKFFGDKEYLMSSESLLEFLCVDEQFLLQKSQQTQDLIEFCLNDFENFEATEENWLKFLEKYHEVVVSKLLPSNIMSLKDLGFVPLAKQIGTRFFGSFVSPCMGCANLMVSNLANVITGQDNFDITYTTDATNVKKVNILNKKSIPATSVFNLDDAISENEKMAYEMYKLIKSTFPADQKKETPEQLQELGKVFKSIYDADDRRFFNTKSKGSCRVCSDGLLISKLKQNLFFGDKKCKLMSTQGVALARGTFKKGAEFGDAPIETVDYKIKIEDEELELVQNILPANTFQVKKFIIPDNKVQTSDRVLVTPLVKFDQNDEAYKFILETENYVTGIISGKRSAIIHSKGKTYRLKGCGNLDQQFVPEAYGDNGEYMVRGCMSEETTLRAVFMTEKISKILRTHFTNTSISCANKPIVLYRYDNENVLDLNNRIVPNFGEKVFFPFCGVFETKGDRRLGDHLLAGIEKLIPIIFQSSLESKELPELLTALKQAVIDERENDWSTSMNAECGNKAYNMTDIYEKLLAPLEFLDKEIDSKLVDASYAKLYEHTFSKVLQGKGTVLRLFKYVAEEVAEFLRILHENGISWGTYPDKLGIHCNAHANNFVVRFNRTKGQSLLCPLDFDMAFDNEQFEPEVLENVTQKMFPTSFAGILNFEVQQGMVMSLAGSTFANTGVSNESEELKLDETKAEFLSLVGIILRDTMLAEFRLRYETASRVEFPRYKREAEEMEQIDLLIKLALMNTSEVVC